MGEGGAEEMLVAATDFRRRLAVKLAARGCEGAALQAKIEELLQKKIPLRLNMDEILGR